MRSLPHLTFFVIALFLSGTMFGQTIEVKDSSGKAVLVFEDELMKEAGSNKILYTIKGNIIFEGASEKQDDIELLVNAENLFSKKKEGSVLDASQQRYLFSVRNGGVFYRDNSTYIDQWLMARFEKEEEGGISMYADTSSKLICHISAQDISTGKLVAVFYYFSRKLDWEDKMSKIVVTPVEPPRATALEDLTAQVRTTSGTIRKLWNTGVEEFIWDGETLKRKWNSFDYEEWTFDGVSLKRLWYPGQEEMEWDGQVLRRKWFSSNDEFEYDGSVIRRRWGNSIDGYIIQGHIIKPTFNSDVEKEWEIDGNIPIPVITIVVFGLLKK